MNDDQDIENKLCNAKCVGEVGPGLRAVEELQHPRKPKKAVESHDDSAWNLALASRPSYHVEDVSRKDAEDVQLEGN